MGPLLLHIGMARPKGCSTRGRGPRSERAARYPPAVARRTAVARSLVYSTPAATSSGLGSALVSTTVGPVYSKNEDRAHLLRSAYTRSLAVADELGAGTVAFPLISSGIYGWPADDAVHQALTAVRAACGNRRFFSRSRPAWRRTSGCCAPRNRSSWSRR